jgi:hypothetical protein
MELMLRPIQPLLGMEVLDQEPEQAFREKKKGEEAVMGFVYLNGLK